MKHLLSLLLVISGLMAGMVVAAPSAYAEPVCPEGSVLDMSDQLCHRFDNDGNETGTPFPPTEASDDILATPPDPAAAGTPTQLPANPKVDGVFATLMTWIVKLFAWLVGIAAMTLNYAVYYTVIKMGVYVNDLSAVGVTWTILRDVGNIVLIFGFLAIGLSTILNYEIYGWKTKSLPMLLLAAVLLNFSLFISEAVVDTGNLFATQVFTQINGGVEPTAETLEKMNGSNEGISNKIMAQLGFQTIYNPQTNPKAFEEGNTWVIAFMGIILFIITAFVFFALAFILIARFVILIFLIIIAPIGFAGLAVPHLSSIAKRWWSTLFEQTITAPILLLLLYIALAVITDSKFLTGLCGGSGCGADGWLGFVDGKNYATFASTLLSFLIAMGLLLAVIIASKKMSAFGGSWATGMAGKLSFGVTGLAGRYSVGLGANYLAKKARSSRLATIPVFGTGVTRGLERVAGSSFDVRGAKFGGGLKSIGVDAGEAQKGGYKEDLKKGIEKRTKYASEIKGKEFKDLTAEEQLAIGNQENEIARLKKEKTDSQKAGTLNPERIKYFNEAIGRAETELDKLHKQAGTETGHKLQYAGLLGSKVLSLGGFLSANAGAAKKIKEEAKKSKEDKDLEALRKALKKAGGDAGGDGDAKPREEKTEEPKAENKGGGEAH